MTVFTNRLRIHKRGRLRRQGRKLTPAEWKRYKNTKMMRYLAGTKEPIYPIGYIQHKNPMAKKRSICSYTAEGRKGLHDNLRVNTKLMHALMSQSCRYRTAEYADNRISLFSAPMGEMRCYRKGISSCFRHPLSPHYSKDFGWNRRLWELSFSTYPCP